MLKNFIGNWQYGIKARVVDGALVAKICTSVEPTTVRISLDKISAATLALQSSGADYDLFFFQPGGNVPIAKFEGREAAEVARRYITCALYHGSKPNRIKQAFCTTAGVLVAILLFAALASAINGLRGTSSTTPSLSLAPSASSLVEMPTTMPSAPTAATPGVPMSADDFLKQ